LVINSRILRGAFLLAVLLLAISGGAGAATLEVVGPAGAEVVLDGETIGLLPLSEPMDLPHGVVFELEVRKPGYLTHRETIWLDKPQTQLVVEVDLLSLNRRAAVISSALLAGTGQFYQGRRTAGWIQLGLQAAAWASVVHFELEFEDRRDEYEKLDQQYKEALTPPDIQRLRDERDAAWSDLEDSKNWRNASIGAVVVIAAYSAWDAWRGHDRFFAEVEPASASLDGSTKVTAGLRWSFGGGAR
jgi:hypothetical protein